MNTKITSQKQKKNVVDKRSARMNEHKADKCA